MPESPLPLPLPSPDSATFLSDITLPDGSAVPPGQALVKTWRVQNSGDTTWEGYKLKFVGGDQMGAPETSIPTTEPQDTVDISINLTAPTQPGDYKAYFQIVNAEGVWVDGGRLWVSIHVLPPPSSNITLSADPPSPASTDQVRIYARVVDFPNLRAMRVLVDGEPIYELGAPEFTCTWHTDGYAAGQHTIVVEVDDWSGPAWDNPQRKSLVYELTGSGPINHAPDRPSLVSPYDWYVSIGSPPQLCAHGTDPEGDTLQYQFEAVASVGTYNSGWVSSDCHTFGSVNAGTYGWRVKTRDSHAESDWSDTWHFSVETSGVTIDELYFEPLDPDQEQVRIRACTSGHGGVNISLSARVNDATDGTDSGQWHIIKELGVYCFNEEDAPIWHTLEYGDGTHLVRVVATATEPPASDVREDTYTLNHRRPASTRLVAPVPLSEDIHEAIYLNSHTITFRWEPTIRADSYTLHVGTNPSPMDDPSPVFRQTFDSSVTEHTVTFSQDHPTLYWQVSATNDVGTNASGDQLFGIDRVAPSCTVQPLPATTYESVFQVNWNGSDNLADIRTFDIQYLDTGRGTWNDWLKDVPATKTYELFTGQPGHIYAFRCRATDNASNMGDYPGSADTSTKVDPTTQPPTPWWDTAYSGKRNLTILNNMPDIALPVGYPVHLHFDSTTTPVAAELYNASQSSPKCNDLRIVYNNATELDRVVQNCSSSAIDIWFRTQASIPGGSSDSTAYQLYYGNPNAGAPPADPHQVWYPYGEGDTAELYFFQEGSGLTAYDSSGNNRHCSLDTSVQWAPSKFGNGLRFNRANGGDSRSLICDGAAALSSFTVEFWYRPDPDDGGRIAGQVGLSGEQTNWLLENLEGRIGLGVWPCPSCGSSGVQSNFDLRDAPYVGNWNHIAVTFNGGDEVRFYINGSLDSTKHLPQSGISTHNAPLEIGSAGGIRQVKANMGAFRISSGVKSSFPYGAFAAITNEPTTAAGGPIVPPGPGSPDLIVSSLTTYPNPDGGVLVQVIVQNQGDLSTQNGFYTDLYLDHLPTGVGDYIGSIHFWVSDPIAAGTTVTLITVITDPSGPSGMAAPTLDQISEHSGTLYVQVDSAGGVSESDEANNIDDVGTEICFASADEYETDNSVAEATVLSQGDPQVHNLSPLADEDWFQIQASGGMTYTIKTSNLGVSADTYLYLYDTDATTLLAANDDYGGTLASQIEWTAPMTDTYYLMVKHWNPNVAGCGTDYTISFEFAPLSQMYLPLIFKAARPPMPDLVVENVIATSNAVTVTIRNQGNVPVPDDAAYEFWVDLYINPSHKPGYNETWQKMGCQGAAWGITWSGSPHSPPGPARQALPLEPGEVFTLTTRGDYYWWSKEGITWPLAQGVSVYAQVDSASDTTSYGGVLESDEDNNVSGPFTVQGFGATSPPVPSPGEGPVVVEEKPEEDISKTSLPPRP